MTYVQYINCDMWKKVIGITLWSLASFGIYVGEYNMVSWSAQDKFFVCLSDPLPDFDKYGNELGYSCHSWRLWSPLDIVIMIIAIAVMLSFLIYWFATGTDVYSIDNKAFQSAKNDCSKLKDYLLMHLDDYYTNEARTLYLVNCK